MRIVLIFTMTICLVQASHAQFFRRIGVQQGVSYSIFELSYSVAPVYADPSYDHLTGYSTRLFTDLWESRYFKVSAGLGFFQLGRGFENEWIFSSGTAGKATAYDFLNYATFDVSATGQLAAGRFVPYVFAGPRIDQLLNSSSYFLYYDVSGNLNKTRYGLRYGAGVALKFKTVRVFAEWAGLYSMVDIIKETRIDYFDLDGGRPESVTVNFSDKVQLFTLGLAIDLHSGSNTSEDH